MLQEEVYHGGIREEYVIQGNLEDVLFKQRAEMCEEIGQAESVVDNGTYVKSPRQKRAGEDHGTGRCEI